MTLARAVVGTGFEVDVSLRGTSVKLIDSHLKFPGLVPASWDHAVNVAQFGRDGACEFGRQHQSRCGEGGEKLHFAEL